MSITNKIAACLLLALVATASLGDGIYNPSGSGGGSGSLPLAGSNLTFKIATTGSDSNPCTTASPCLTLQRALNVAAGYNWQGQFSPTINIANGTYASTQVVLPPLVAAIGGTITGNTGSPTSVVLTDSGTAYTIEAGSFSNWTLGGVSIGGTFGGITTDASAALYISAINIRGNLSQNGIFVGAASLLYNLGTTLGVTATHANSLIFYRGETILNTTVVTFANAITFTQSVILGDSVPGFMGFFNSSFINASNVTAGGGASFFNGAFFETGPSTVVDGVAMSRDNFPGGAVTTDLWSIFQPDGSPYFTSSDTNATNIVLENTSVGGKSYSFGSTGSANGFGPGLFQLFNNDDFRGVFNYQFAAGADSITLPNTLAFGWDGSTQFGVPANRDTAISRVAAGVMGVGTGAGGNTDGQIKAAAHVAGGSVPTGTTGSCSVSTFTGGKTAGKFTAPLCAAGTIILSGLPTSPNGWTCNAQDQTTSTDTLKQTANTVSSVTFLATTAASDVVVFQCMGW